MSPRIFTAFIMAAIPLCGGIWATLVGFEYIGKPPDAQLNPRYPIRRRLYRLCGPVVIVLGLWVAIQPIVVPLHGVEWEEFSPAGFGFSIELPGRPEETVIEETGKYGPVTNHLARVQLPSLRTTNIIQYTPLPKDLPPATVPQRKERLKELVAAIVKESEGELIDEESVIAPGGVGRDFRIKLKNALIYRGQFWLLGHTQFQLATVGPSDVIDTDISRRFFDSFKFTAPPAVPADSKTKADDDSNATKPDEKQGKSGQEWSDHEKHETHENE